MLDCFTNKILVLENKYKIVMPLFATFVVIGALETPQIFTDLGLKGQS